MAAIELLTIPETARTLRIDRRTVYRLIAAGDLDAVDIAPTGSTRSKTRVPAASVAQFIERRSRNAADLRTA